MYFWVQGRAWGQSRASCLNWVPNPAQNNILSLDGFSTALPRSPARAMLNALTAGGAYHLRFLSGLDSSMWSGGPKPQTMQQGGGGSQGANNSRWEQQNSPA